MSKKKTEKKSVAAVQRKKFLVVSLDTDEQQWFYDFVMASSQREAEEFVAKNRPYIAMAGATDSLELSEMSHRLDQQTVTGVQEQMEALRKQHADEEDEPYVPTNYWDASGQIIKRL